MFKSRFSSSQIGLFGRHKLFYSFMRDIKQFYCHFLITKITSEYFIILIILHLTLAGKVTN